MDGLAHVCVPSILLFDSHLTCSIGGRKKTACCKVTKATPQSLKCKKTTCGIDPSLCVIAATGSY